MNRLQIPVLPHIVNAGIATSIYSAGSAFFFNGSRVLHALAIDGYAPKFMRHTNRNGVPWVACLVVLAVGCLSYLQVSAGTSKVLGWFIDVATATQVRLFLFCGGLRGDERAPYRTLLTFLPLRSSSLGSPWYVPHFLRSLKDS